VAIDLNKNEVVGELPIRPVFMDLRWRAQSAELRRTIAERAAAGWVKFPLLVNH